MSELAIGEIIETGTVGFTAECLELPRGDTSGLYDPPALGSFVKVLPVGPVSTQTAATVENPDSGDEPDPFLTIVEGGLSQCPNLSAASYGLVAGARSGSLEMGRRPSALGYADEDEMRFEQPQIFELMRTEFQVVLVAYSDGTQLRRHLPPVPPRLHRRVYPCDPAEVRAITADLTFLRSILLQPGGLQGGVSADELTAACLRQAYQLSVDKPEFLLRAGKALATILAADYDRLVSILRNVR